MAHQVEYISTLNLKAISSAIKKAMNEKADAYENSFENTVSIILTMVYFGFLCTYKRASVLNILWKMMAVAK